MKTLTAIVIALALSTGTALAQVLPQPKPGSPRGSYPFGYMSSRNLGFNRFGAHTCDARAHEQFHTALAQRARIRP
jgi:hypothetical protein